MTENIINNNNNNRTIIHGNYAELRAICGKLPYFRLLIRPLFNGIISGTFRFNCKSSEIKISLFRNRGFFRNPILYKRR